MQRNSNSASKCNQNTSHQRYKKNAVEILRYNCKKCKFQTDYKSNLRNHRSNSPYIKTSTWEFSQDPCTVCYAHRCSRHCHKVLVDLIKEEEKKGTSSITNQFKINCLQHMKLNFYCANYFVSSSL